MSLWFVSTEVFAPPGAKRVNAETVRELPVRLAEEARGVFSEEAGILHDTQCVQILIHNILILCLFFLPGINQMAPRTKFTRKAAGTCRIVVADFELAGTLDQAVGHPALIGGVIVGEGAGRKVEGITVRNAITGIDFATAGDEREEH